MLSSDFSTENGNLHNLTVDLKSLADGRSPINPPHSAGDLWEIEAPPPDSAERLTDWGFLLAETLTYAPWSPQGSLWVDRAIALREGGEA